MKRFVISLIFIAIFITPLMASEQLDEANAKFTYKGQPIHPLLVSKLSNWISDNRPPMVTAVDIAASFDTNQYQQSDIKKRDEAWFYEEERYIGDIREYESFYYQWLGKMADNIHVLEIGESGGGSGTFMDLLFVRFSEGEVMWEGKKAGQLLMSVVGTYRLGDRYGGEIKVYPDRVFIPASDHQHGGGSIEKDTEVRLPKE